MTNAPRLLVWALLISCIVCNLVIATTISLAMRTVADAMTTLKVNEDARLNFSTKLRQLEVQAVNALETATDNQRRITRLEGDKR